MNSVIQQLMDYQGGNQHKMVTPKKNVSPPRRVKIILPNNEHARVEDLIRKFGGGKSASPDRAQSGRVPKLIAKYEALLKEKSVKIKVAEKKVAVELAPKLEKKVNLAAVKLATPKLEKKMKSEKVFPMVESQAPFILPDSVKSSKVENDEKVALDLARELAGEDIVLCRRARQPVEDAPLERPFREGEFQEFLKWLKEHGDHYETKDISELVLNFYRIKINRRNQCRCGKTAAELGLLA